MNKNSNTDPKVLPSPFRVYNEKAQVQSPHDKMLSLLFKNTPDDYNKPCKNQEDKNEIIKDVALEKREFAEEFSEITTEPTFNVKNNSKI